MMPSAGNARPQLKRGLISSARISRALVSMMISLDVVPAGQCGPAMGGGNIEHFVLQKAGDTGHSRRDACAPFDRSGGGPMLLPRANFVACVSVAMAVLAGPAPAQNPPQNPPQKNGFVVALFPRGVAPPPA